MTRRTLPALLAWAGLMAWGCGPSTPPAPAARYAAPHGGVLFPFPNKKGSVEITSEPAKDVAGASRQNSHQIAAYFFEADGTTPLAAAPADVKVALGEPTPIPLAPQGVPGRFASPPGPYAGEVRGTLTASVGGEPVEVAFTKR